MIKKNYGVYNLIIIRQLSECITEHNDKFIVKIVLLFVFLNLYIDIVWLLL